MRQYLPTFCYWLSHLALASPSPPLTGSVSTAGELYLGYWREAPGMTRSDDYGNSDKV
ncbi:MAG TPA: hypothetical protein V6D50_12560 [Chroococcales cyanobacterium]